MLNKNHIFIQDNCFPTKLCYGLQNQSKLPFSETKGPQGRTCIKVKNNIHVYCQKICCNVIVLLNVWNIYQSMKKEEVEIHFF